jgi:serine/threonine-protein kinase HipA
MNLPEGVLRERLRLAFAKATGTFDEFDLLGIVGRGEASLAPVYDLVTTSVYLPKDSMALALNGTTKWASLKELQRLGETRMGAAPARVREILERVSGAISDTSRELRTYLKDHPDFEDIGNLMLHEWEQGVAFSLKTA